MTQCQMLPGKHCFQKLNKSRNEAHSEEDLHGRYTSSHMNTSIRDLIIYEMSRESELALYLKKSLTLWAMT